LAGSRPFTWRKRLEKRSPSVRYFHHISLTVSTFQWRRYFSGKSCSVMVKPLETGSFGNAECGMRSAEFEMPQVGR
jgi:hypothetical protein